jgi:predicted peptidase
MAQDNIDGFLARNYKNSFSQTMPYRLFVPPGYDKAHKYPLIVWLHGASGIGSDNLAQIQGDQIPGTRTWTNPETQAKHPAFVLVPQANQPWDPYACRIATSERADPNLSEQLVLVLGILDSLKVEFPIDSKRIYVAGQSIGAFGTWCLITNKPDLFAAAITLCGGGNADLAANAKRLPIWAFQGDADVFRDSHRRMIAALRLAGGKPRYTEYPGVGHEIWDRVFKEPGLVDWLFAQHK